MKKLFTFIIIAMLSFSTIAQEKTTGSVTFKVTTKTANGSYAPKHVLAAWITTSSGTFVKSMKVMAAQRKQYLYAWKASSAGSTVSAITGSTLSSHQTHTLTWDCKNLSGVDVADGDYQLWVEFTEKDGTGPKQSYTFTKGTNAVSLTPANVTNFTSVSITYTPVVNAVEDINSTEQNVQIFPNPFSEEVKIVINDSNSKNSKIQIYNTTGKLIKVLSPENSNNGSVIFNWNAKNTENQEVAKGIYFYTYKSEKVSYSGKLIYVN